MDFLSKENPMPKKKIILYVDSAVYAAIRKKAYETEQFRSHIIETILAEALEVKVDEKATKKDEVVV